MLPNQEHLSVLKRGVEAWNQWRIENRHILPDLRYADLASKRLTGIMLDEANLFRANLAGAVLQGAKLRRVVLGGANLNSADLCGVNLGGSHLGRASLRDAILKGARIRGVNFYGADLSGADLTGAEMGWVVFANTDLSSVKGLDTIQHVAPSSIGLDTLYRSGGSLPDVFLRGAGVPGFPGTLTEALAIGTAEFHSCFISYSTKDQEFAEQLWDDLQKAGVRCWFAPESLQGGKKLHEQIEEAIFGYDRLLLILSEHSMNSTWVMTEISGAREKELKEKRQVLFPIRLVPFESIRDWKCFDPDTSKDAAREIREYFIPDFGAWKDDLSYQKALQQLLRDLASATQRETMRTSADVASH